MEYAAIYRMGVETLKAAGIEEALLDARLLLEEACGTDRNTLLAHGDFEVSPRQEECYMDYIRFHNWGTDGKTELPFLCFEMYEICPEIIQVDFWLSYVLKY